MSAALELLDVPAVWRAFDVQLGARMATAVHDVSMLDRTVTIRTLLIASAFLDECDNKGAAELPLAALALDEDGLRRLEAATRRWIKSSQS